MSINYSLVQRGNPRDPSAPKKFYAQVKVMGEVTLRELAEEIAKISTVSVIDTKAVLDSLLEVIPSHINDSEIVRLGELGSFAITLKSEGADTEDAFTASMIKRVKLLFKPGKLFKKQMATADFKKE